MRLGKIGWDNYVPNREDGVDLIILVSYEAQLFFHSTHIGVCEIRSIEIIGEVH